MTRESVEKMIAKGASLCGECNGAGGTIHGVCIGCHGEGYHLEPAGVPPQGTKGYCRHCGRSVGLKVCGADPRYWELVAHVERKNGIQCGGIGAFLPSELPASPPHGTP